MCHFYCLTAPLYTIWTSQVWQINQARLLLILPCSCNKHKTNLNSHWFSSVSPLFQMNNGSAITKQLLYSGMWLPWSPTMALLTGKINNSVIEKHMRKNTPSTMTWCQFHLTLLTINQARCNYAKGLVGKDKGAKKCSFLDLYGAHQVLHLVCIHLALIYVLSNAWRMLTSLVTQVLQSWVSTVLCNLWREVN